MMAVGLLLGWITLCLASQATSALFSAPGTGYSTAEFLDHICTDDGRSEIDTSRSKPIDLSSVTAPITKMSKLNTSSSSSGTSNESRSNLSINSISSRPLPVRCTRKDVSEIIYCSIMQKINLSIRSYRSKVDWPNQPGPLMILIAVLKPFIQLTPNDSNTSTLIYPQCTQRDELFDIALETFAKCGLRSPQTPQRYTNAKEKVDRPFYFAFLAKMCLHLLSQPNDFFFGTVDKYSAPLPCWEPELLTGEYLYRQRGRWDVDSDCVDVIGNVLRRSVSSAISHFSAYMSLRTQLAKIPIATALAELSLQLVIEGIPWVLNVFIQVWLPEILSRFKEEAATRRNLSASSDLTNVSCQLRGRLGDVAKSVTMVIRLILANEIAKRNHSLGGIITSSFLNTLYTDGMQDAF